MMKPIHVMIAIELYVLIFVTHNLIHDWLFLKMFTNCAYIITDFKHVAY